MRSAEWCFCFSILSYWHSARKRFLDSVRLLTSPSPLLPDFKLLAQRWDRPVRSYIDYALTSWLKAVVSDNTMSYYAEILAALADGVTIDALEAASSIAIENGNYRLSLLLTSLGTQSQHYYAQQLEIWNDSGAQAHIDSDLLRIISLLSRGVDIVERATDDMEVEEEDDGEEDNTSMPMVADDNEGEEDNTSMNEDDDDTTLPQIEPIKKASADAVNMAVKGTARWELACKFAIEQCGWEKEELDECLQFISDWAAKIVDGEDSIEYKQFQSYDYEESEGKKWTYSTNKKRVLGDVNYLIQARKLGGVSVHSVCLEDPTKLTITRLPAINDTNVDYLRSKILFELYGVQDVIAHIHDGLVNYHQYAYNALTWNTFPFGYNAATSASNIIYSHGKLTVRPKKIFKQTHAYLNNGNICIQHCNRAGI